MRKTKEEADITRQKIMQAALTVFSRAGYAEARLEDIGAAAGVTRGAVYHHFAGGKAELYTTLVSELSGRVMPLLQAAAADPSPLNALRHIFTETLVYAATDADFRAMNELVAFKTAVTPELEAGMRQKIAGQHAMIAFLAEKVQAGIAAGEIRADVDPRDAAFMLVAAQQGVLLMWLLDDRLFPLRERAAALADLLFRSLTP